MNLDAVLRWLLSWVQPFHGWRVPVAILKGAARQSGKQVTLLAAGQKRWTLFITQRFFAEAPEVERMVQVPVWHLQKLLEQWQSAADLTVVGIDRISARLFLGKNYLTAPPLVSSWIPVPDDLKTFARKNENAASDMRRTRIKKFEKQCSQSKADFDLFYDHFHSPYILARYGEAAHVAPRWLLRHRFKHGMILWLCRNGERLAGDLITVKGAELGAVVTGIRDGRLELLKEGVLSAIYVQTLYLAKELGCTKIHVGGSNASLHDGVLRYKSKWGGIIFAYDGSLSSNYVTLLKWCQLNGAVAEFLSHTSIIHHDNGGLSAFWVFPNHLPLTAASLHKEYRRLRAAGLHRFRILIPGKVPPDFVCPPEVRLIELGV